MEFENKGRIRPLKYSKVLRAMHKSPCFLPNSFSKFWVKIHIEMPDLFIFQNLPAIYSSKVPWPFNLFRKSTSGDRDRLLLDRFGDRLRLRDRVLLLLLEDDPSLLELPLLYTPLYSSIPKIKEIAMLWSVQGIFTLIRKHHCGKVSPFISDSTFEMCSRRDFQL